MSSGPARYAVLGPVELRDGTGVIALGSPSQRAVLSILLARSGEHVPADTLIDVLWGPAPPRTARESLRSHVSRLRRHLGPRLAGSADGYAIRLGPGELDADRFDRAIVTARARPPADAVTTLAAALGLWRGPAFGAAADLAPVRARARALDQARIGARHEHCRALLAAGRPGEAVGAAEALTADEPLHEPGWAVLIEALAAAGRPADGLAAFRRARTVLLEEGLEPSDVLRQAQAVVLAPAGSRPGRLADRRIGPATSRLQPVQRAGAPERERAGAPDQAGPVGADGPAGATHVQRPLEPWPAPSASLVGRSVDLRSVADLLATERLVTLVGPGGVGKTTLAREVARAVGHRHPRGWRIVELAAIADPAAVPDAVVSGLGLTAESSAPDLLPRIGGLDLLVVLDNCEHLIDDVAAAVSAMLRPGGRLRLLATSRERLGLPGERVWPVEPLPTDGDDSPAHRLFRLRAEAARPGSVGGGGDDAAVGAVVRRLDGLPLAIEMAAARVATLSPADLAVRIEERLEQRADPLADGRRRGDPRHRTLRSVIEWSAVLLSDVERRALSGWAVFSGAVTIEDATAVLRVEPEVVESLAARSLLSLDVASGRTRYRMLRTVRAAVGALERDVARRHAVHFAAVAAVADAGLRTPAEAQAHQRLEGILDELRAAHAWARAEDVALAVAMSRSLHLYGVSRLQHQVLGWAARLGPLLPARDPGAAVPDSGDTPVPDPGAGVVPSSGAAVVHASVAARLIVSGDLSAARRRAELALAGASDPAGRIHALESLADIALFEGRLADSLACSDELVAEADRVGDLHHGIVGRGGAVLALEYGGRHAEAGQRLAALTARPDRALAPSDRAWIAYFSGEHLLDHEPDAAAAALRRAIALADSAGARYVGGVARVSATSLQARQGAPDSALELFAEVVRHWLAVGSWAHLLTTLRNLVDLLDRVRQDDAAAELYGAVSRPDLTPSYGVEAERLDRARAQLSGRLGEARFATRAQAGARRDLEAAARAVLTVLPGSPSPADPPGA